MTAVSSIDGGLHDLRWSLIFYFTCTLDCKQSSTDA